MPWFIRSKKNITTPTESKKDVKKGLWYKTLPRHQEKLLKLKN